jgi:ribosomal protein S18 acetylase RimI-like enzyme
MALRVMARGASDHAPGWTTPNAMHIRSADLADIDAIVALDHSYMTDHVWQMSGRDTNSEYNALFRLARLPRLLNVPYPHDERTLRRTLHRCDRVWVMEGQSPSDILGYIGMASMPWQNSGWLPCFAVAPAARRQGIATQLLRTVTAQAKADGLQSLTIDIQTKNYPATCMAQSRGFRFAGYADNYYSARDIALFFAYRIR